MDHGSKQYAQEHLQLSKWNITQSSDCSFCHMPETLLHIVAGCKTYLEEGRYTWHHNSTLDFLAQSLKAIPNCTLYADLSGYLLPSIITGDSFRPDLLLVTSDHRLFILELTVGYETNLDVNANRKREKYSNLIHSRSSAYSSIMFVNLSISSLGIFGLSCSSFIEMCNALDISEDHLRFMISKLSNLTIRTTYYIFCRRNKSWNNPELIQF